MNNINKPRFLSSVFLLTIITVAVYSDLEASAALLSQTQTFLSEYLGWLIILIANGFLIFSIYLVFTKYSEY
jgi:choline-glycine betaine transporter